MGLGSNLGDRKKYMVSAIARIDSCKDICVVSESGFYETKPVGGPSQPDYVNCVIELDTEIEPQSLLQEFKRIELELGRTSGVRWGSRVIDIDILLYRDTIISDSNLKIPHESMHERIFVLEPLCEISPGFKHPVSGKTIIDLLKELKVSRKR